MMQKYDLETDQRENNVLKEWDKEKVVEEVCWILEDMEV